MERLHLLNRLEQLCHVDRKPSNQSIFIPHVEHVKRKTTPIVVQHGVIYPQGTWLAKSVLGPGERSQVPHHKSVPGRNEGVGTITCSYCYQMKHMFNRSPFVDDKLK